MFQAAPGCQTGWTSISCVEVCIGGREDSAAANNREPRIEKQHVRQSTSTYPYNHNYIWPKYIINDCPSTSQAMSDFAMISKRFIPNRSQYPYIYQQLQVLS